MDTEPSGGQTNIFFIYHHAPADGLSGAAFHRGLLQELHTISTELPT
jgi:hypothetical protein